MRALPVIALATMLLAGCGTPSESARSAQEPALTVFAAASLSAAFTEIGADFGERHGARITFNFAGSATLVAQVDQGAAADVLAVADEPSMARTLQAGLVAGEPERFASNRLTIVTEPGNPADVDGFADLGSPRLKVVVCAPVVPCGAAARRVEELTGTELRPVSEEASVTDVLSKVTSGQADAGLVYRTDAQAAGASVTAVDFPEAAEVVNHYPIAALAGSEQPDLAAEFIAFVRGPGQAVLAEAGFGRP